MWLCSAPEQPTFTLRYGRPVLPYGLGCPACRTPLRRRQKACSAKCRAALSRLRRETAREQRDREVRSLIEAALRKLEEGSPMKPRAILILVLTLGLIAAPLAADAQQGGKVPRIGYLSAGALTTDP